VKQDRVVVITGAAGGIGSVLVDRFLANGDTVIATDTTKEHLEQLVSSRNAGQRLIMSPADIFSEHECLELANLAGETAGRIDVLVNCAGVDCVGIMTISQVASASSTTSCDHSRKFKVNAGRAFRIRSRKSETGSQALTIVKVTDIFCPSAASFGRDSTREGTPLG